MTSQELRQSIENVNGKVAQLDAEIGALAVAQLDGGKLQPGQVAGLLADKHVAGAQLVELRRRLRLAEDDDLRTQIADLSAQEAALAAEMAPLDAEMTALEREHQHLPTSPVYDVLDSEIAARGTLLQARFNGLYN